MFDFREFFQVGRFTEVESSNIEYSDGTGGIQVILYLEYIDTDYYYIETIISPISSGEVEHNGLLALNHTYYTEGRSRRRMLLSWDPPSKSFYDNIAFFLSKDSVITINGSALVEFVVDGTTIVNATISYDITFIIPLGVEDYQNIALFIYVIFFLYFLSIPLMPFILSQIFKPVFGVKFDKDTRERNEKFSKYFSEKAKEKKLDDNNSK
jgi:hypothetical protein